MNCPTCGKSVRHGQQVCSYCGALIADLGSAKKSGLRTPELEKLQRAVLRKLAPATPGAGPPEMPTAAPEMEEEEEFKPEEVEPAPARSGTPQPTPPPWMRWVSPIFFLIVFFVLQFWLRNPEPVPRDTAQPVLRQAVLCESVSEGRPLGPKTAFSLRADRQVTLFGRWEGDPANHSFTLRVYAPDGTRRTDPAVRVTPEGRQGFTTEVAFALEPSLPLGQWRVELMLDLERAARLPFELRE
jgi:hypothetical protein